MTAPYRFDQVGSLLRTTALKQAHQQFTAGEIDAAALQTIQQAAIKPIVEKQIKLGLHAVTDGEFSRSWWHLDFLWGLTGVDKYDYEKSYKFHGSKTRTDNVTLTGKVAYNPDHPFFAAFSYLQSLVPAGVVAKQTIPSPSMLFRDNRSDNAAQFYADHQDYLDDLATAYHETLLRFYALGCRYIQLDDTTWAYLIDRLNATKDDPTAQKGYQQIAEDTVYVINKLLAGLPADLTVTTHICRGNFRSTFLFSGGYEVVADYLGQLNYNGLFLEYDNDRAGDFAPLAKIWQGDTNKRIVLGLVTSKFPELEDQATLIKRINEAAAYVPLANLALSTQCGFASTEEGNQLTADQQWAKLQLVIDTAKKVWPEAK
ncbi:vitamin B12 independent methionine synthase [Loigolactobacillus zhaoyuanensis]|uniref:Vitamin B12 independent methionine synthase n=1 Tax=Loigolactobacillus zhaoyuanensis TaxID=2486017 RepID=A0ABW8UCE5_9LACO|nr:vitamin B12 independent methionine synthase [Loigolactobacillus zhaoyuanensis]